MAELIWSVADHLFSVEILSRRPERYSMTGAVIVPISINSNKSGRPMRLARSRLAILIKPL